MERGLTEAATVVCSGGFCVVGLADFFLFGLFCFPVVDRSFD